MVNLKSSNSFINDDIFFERKNDNGYANGGFANGHANGGFVNGHTLKNLHNNLSNNSSIANSVSNSNSINNKQNGGGRGEDMQLRDRIKKIVNKENSEVSGKLQNIIDMISEEMETKRHNEDWVELTVVLDRFFFMLFVLTILLTVVIVISDAPELNL